MTNEGALLESIKQLVKSGKYRIRMHTVRHMIEEGFNETNVIETITGKSRILEDYTDDCRCLILGTFHFTEATTFSFACCL
jgi:hypothetical protein